MKQKIKHQKKNFSTSMYKPLSKIKLIGSSNRTACNTSKCEFRFSLFIVLLMLAFTSSNAAGVGGSIRYVKTVASGSGSGSSWANASSNLQAMIQASAEDDEVWVAAGTYFPTNKPYNASGIEVTTADPRHKTFHIKSGVGIYGGFLGNETNKNQRLITTNVTSLSGDIGALNNTSDNCYSVILGLTFNGGSIVIDGFTIKGGNANSFTSHWIGVNSIAADYGAGIHIINGSSTIQNNTIIGNAAATYGGGIYLKNGSSTLSNNTIVENTATQVGAGLHIDNGFNNLANTVFSGNTSNYGGGIGVGGGVNTFANITFSRNKGSLVAGAIYTAGGTNTIRNSIFWGNIVGFNSTTEYGADYYRAFGTLATTFINNLMQLDASIYTVSNLNSPSATSSGNLFNTNPLFVNDNDIDGADNKHRTADDGLYLQSGSPMINSGTSVGALIIDIIGTSRPQGAGIDMGAYEWISPCNTSYNTLNVTICQGSSYVFNGVARTSQGTYLDTLANAGGCDSILTLNLIVTPQPAIPTLACYQTASFNTTTCVWDITGTQPVMPTIACYETATFNTTSCAWDVTGTQQAMPTVACYETATFNATTCTWDVTGTQAAQPTLACYQTASFNTTTCGWDITGTQPVMPTVACYETATFNISTCTWDVTGTQPAMPTLACYETASFNTTSCAWDVTGTQPAMPTLACYETASFNGTTCAWDVTGTQPQIPTLACYETATFSTTSCAWDVTGSQPAQPTLACYETALFNTQSCAWDVTGTAPIVTASNAILCVNSSVNLVGTPAGGTFSVANPYSGPATTFTYTLPGGCGSATGNIIIASSTPAIINPVTVLGTTTATITWAAVPGSNAYYLWYRAVGTSTWITPAVTGTSVSLSGLSPNTNYECKIRNNNVACSLLGAFGGLTSFTTTNQPCGTATTLISPITVSSANKATITWNTIANVAQYNIWYKATTATTWSTALVAGSVSSLTTATLAPGTYEVKIRNRCNGVSTFTPFGAVSSFTVGASLKGMNETVSNAIQVFPNPTTSMLNIEFNSNQSGLTKLKLSDVSGRLIKEIQTNTTEGINSIQMDMHAITNGLYMLQITHNNEIISTHKVEKK